MKAKLKELGVGEHIQQVVMGGIFGKQFNSQQIEGLIDSCDEEQFEELEALSEKWKTYDMSGNVRKSFHAFGVWFKQYKGSLLKKDAKTCSHKSWSQESATAVYHEC